MRWAVFQPIMRRAVFQMMRRAVFQPILLKDGSRDQNFFNVSVVENDKRQIYTRTEQLPPKPPSSLHKWTVSDSLKLNVDVLRWNITAYYLLKKISCLERSVWGDPIGWWRKICKRSESAANSNQRVESIADPRFPLTTRYQMDIQPNYWFASRRRLGKVQ